MLVALVLAISGCFMISVGLTDEGMIDVKTPFITGQIKTGFVGMLLVFCSVVCVVATLGISRSLGQIHKPPIHTIEIAQGDTKIVWSGPIHFLDEAPYIEHLLHTVARSLGRAGLQSEAEPPSTPQNGSESQDSPNCLREGERASRKGS